MGESNIQPNRRFKLERTVDGISLEEASKRLNISQKALSSIFNAHDTNRNGKIENESTNELEGFLSAINAHFTRTETKDNKTTQVITYESADGLSVTEYWDEQGRITKKK